MRRFALWIALVGIGLVAEGVIAAPAAACKEISPGVCQESGMANLPPDSYGSQSTDTVPPASTQAVITLTPQAPSDNPPFHDLWLAIVDQQPSLGGIKNQIVQRFVTCQLLAAALNASNLDAQNVRVPARVFTTTQDATFYVCLALAFSEPPASQATAAASRPCEAPVGVPIQISRSGSGYRVAAQGRTFKPRRPPLAVSCRPKGSGLVISLRARRRRGTLRGLLGPHLTIGFANRGSRSVRLRTTYRFSR